MLYHIRLLNIVVVVVKEKTATLKFINITKNIDFVKKFKREYCFLTDSRWRRKESFTLRPLYAM
jgi:hypothetical protein